MPSRFQEAKTWWEGRWRTHFSRLGEDLPVAGSLVSPRLEVGVACDALPLLDGRVTPKERAQLANRLVRTKLESRKQAVIELVSDEADS